MGKTLYYGGSFAPALSVAQLAIYKTFADGAEPQVKGLMSTLIKMVEVFNAAPAKVNSPIEQHKSGTGFVIKLDPETIAAIDSHVPWHEEIEMMGKVFDRIPALDIPLVDRPLNLRDAAFHLLWYAAELANDREPITQESLP